MASAAIAQFILSTTRFGRNMLMVGSSFRAAEAVGVRTWRTVTTSSGTSAVTVPGTPHARYVRLRSPVGLDESLSAEVSIWS